MSFFVCQQCRKRVMPKRGKLTCCGITEAVEYAEKENEAHGRRVASANRNLSRDINRALFPDPVITHWNDEDEEFNDYEGIPNT